jgi:hypothetical protein
MIMKDSHRISCESFTEGKVFAITRRLLLLSGLAGACACAGVKIVDCWYRYSVLSDPLSSRRQALLAVIQ